MNTNVKFRLSKQRKVILEELRRVNTHPTADEVYDMVRKIIPRISLGTVYRNLEFLCSQGLAMKVGPAGSQKRFDGNAHPHPHLRCQHCGKVEDFHIPLQLPNLDSDTAMGYEITSCNIEFVGVCPECAGVSH